MLTIHLIILLDYFTPFNSFENSLSINYHHHLLSSLPDRAEQQVPVLYQHNVTKESFSHASKGYTFPVVIRGTGNSAQPHFLSSLP
jgi:hypothetical protein